MATSFVALYRGTTVADARLVAVSADAGLVADVSTRLLQLSPRQQSERVDPVLIPLDQGRRRALRTILEEVHH